MMAWIRRALAAPVFEDDEKTRAAGLLNTLLWALLGAVGSFAVVGLALPRAGLALAFAGGTILAALAALLLMWRGYVRGASLLLVVFVWGLLTVAALFFVGVYSAAVYGYVVITLITGMLLGGRAGFLLAGLSVLTGLSMLWADRTGWLPNPAMPASPAATWAALSVYLAIAASVVHIAISNLNRALMRAQLNERELADSNRELALIRASLEGRVADRTRGLMTAAEVSRAIALRLDPNELFPYVVNLVRDRFELYYAGLFLVDENGEWTGEPARWAVLRAGTGEAGRQMLAQGHKLAIGGESMIGQCVARNEARIALDVGKEAMRFDNPLLPETRSEMALPLRAPDTVIGAMTVQSTREAAFDEADIAVLQTVADQMAVAIRNAQLFALLQDTLGRSQSVVRRYVQDSWDRFVTAGKGITGYRRAMGSAGPDADARLPLMADVVSQQAPWLTAEDEDGSFLAVPLTSSGEVIGAVGLRRPVGTHWSQDGIAVAQAVSQEVAQAVERMRLLEETRQNARRESVLRYATDRVRSQANLDAVLRVAVEELRRVMGASRVTIRLGTEGRPDLLADGDPGPAVDDGQESRQG